MTLTPNTQITQENVGLLKAGDRVKVTNACSYLKSEGYPNGSLVTVRSVGGEYIDIAEIPYPQSTYAHRFTYIGPDLGDGWIGWSGGENPVPGMSVSVRYNLGENEMGESDCFLWEPGPFNRLRIVAFRPALSPPAEGEDAIDERTGHPSSYTSRTPTPVPVDWQRVGPKLVEESAAIMKLIRKFVHDLPDSVCDGYAHNLDPLIEAIDSADTLRAALAATQPQSNGE